MQERLQKYMARCGVASRRKSEELITEGKVKINGVVVKDVVLIDTDKDVIEVNGKIIRPEENKVYIMLNKPTEVITSVKDQFNRKTVLDIVKADERLFPVGRLDYDTSGLLILTNDGEVTYRMTHPSHEIDKVYVAEVLGIPTDEEMELFRRGLKIEDYITSPAEIKIIKFSLDRKKATLEITIHEGRNRQVRKMCEKINHPVLKLKRVKIGQLSLGDLKEGEWRYLSKAEVEYLKSI
ncbi:ribosomal large subunit pseudouridine synthase B [Fervidicella metallireducens AeB]|uniref:Pseudouridine synthase n=1 Tax=Fervidicella metallireducens AeB TaxID=1403537 RepID=A0A017RV37_9CLOT|nr:pseudouridine synthase [Fervidicella metallireducens]EYE87775.1 ribosomal large subunit pseudouridine synthase B [Fervidicella metallireducens AeB]